MYRLTDSLNKHNRKVCTIKTDALTVKNDDLSLAQQLLEVEPGVGKWRHSTTGEDICFPTRPLGKIITHSTQVPKQEKHFSSNYPGVIIWLQPNGELAWTVDISVSPFFWLVILPLISMQT